MAENKKKVETTEVVKEEMVTIKLPKIRGGADSEYVSVNDRTWQIQRGVAVEVPACVAEVLDTREKQLERAYDFLESVTSTKK